MDIIERIKKLANLSRKNDSTAEAASAAAKMQELAFQHNLDLEKVLAEGTEAKTPYVKFDYLMPDTESADVGWKRVLFRGVCKGNFCQAVTLPRTTRMAVVGQKHNYEVVCYTYEYLTREIQRLAIDHCIKQGFLTSKDKRRYIAGFCEGAATECYHKLVATQKAQAQTASDCMALVVRKGKELTDAVKTHFPRLRHSVRRASGSSAGYGDGRIAGKGISVNRGVGSNNGRVQIA
jgi:hypothetical protein